MVGRISQPAVSSHRVDDDRTQRALDQITTALKSVLSFLRPYVEREKWKKVTLPLLNGATVNREVEIKKDPHGVVAFRGGIAVGSDTLVLTLPVGYRPPQTTLFSVSSGQPLEITASGEVRFTIASLGDSILFEIRFDTE